MTKSKTVVPFKEWVWYLIASILVAWGLAEMICGLILQFAQVSITETPLFEANQKFTELFGLSFLYWGIILLVIGTIVAVTVLCVYAVSYDRESEKQSRRAARLRNKETVIKEGEVSEVETTEAK